MAKVKTLKNFASFPEFLNFKNIFLDILFALSTLGFDPYAEPLKLYLTKYRESIKGDKSLGEEGMPDENAIQISSQQMVQLV